MERTILLKLLIGSIKNVATVIFSLIKKHGWKDELEKRASTWEGMGCLFATSPSFRN